MAEPNRGPQVLRRDFLVGAAAGVAAGVGGGRAVAAVQPLGWTLNGLPRQIRPSFAQTGEDLVVAAHLDSLRVAAPTYLDVGAYDPVDSNNTYLFYGRGGRGVLVEPNVALTPKLRRARPRDTVLEAGIGIDDTPAADYFVLDDAQLNTFDREQADRLVREHGRRVERVVQMPLLNINRVMADHFGGAAPDFLSIDVEGLDLAILRTLDFGRFRPKVICAETLVTMTTRHNPETLALLAGKGYELRGMTYANVVFVDGRLYG